MNVELEDRVVKFTSRCIKVCVALPDRKIGSTSLADQVFRSATSVAANYAEAEEAESRKDFIHKLKIAMKELSEEGTIRNARVAQGHRRKRLCREA